MGFLCNDDKKVIVSQETLSEITLKRNLGLDNVYNVNSSLIVCPEVFRSPEFYVNGATKLVSGLTSTLTGCTTATTLSIYNLDYVPNFNVDFIITGGTDYTGYTGNFCYKIFTDERFVAVPPYRGLVNGSESINTCVAFSAITIMTSSTVTQQFVEGGLERTWRQYMIRPYYGFVTKDCHPGLVFNTWDSTTQVNNFQSESDYYFVTVVNPPTPNLAPPGGEILQPYSFIQDNLYMDGTTTQKGPQAINDERNYFILRANPAADIMVFVNGVKMTGEKDYRLISRGFGTPPIVEFLTPIKKTDWVIANYLVGTPSSFLSGDFSQWFIDTWKIDVITVDAPFPGYVNTVNKNTITGNYEAYLTQPIDPKNAVFCTVNGVELVQNQQFFLSVSEPNRIIFDKAFVDPLKPGDVISFLGISPNFIFGGNNYGSIPTTDFTIQWWVPSELPKNVSGNFIVQVFKKDDPSNLVMYQKTQPFVNGLANYTTTINNIALNLYYRFRVTFEAEYTAYLDNKITTCSFSEGYFDTTSRYLNNTY